MLDVSLASRCPVAGRPSLSPASYLEESRPYRSVSHRIAFASSRAASRRSPRADPSVLTVVLTDDLLPISDPREDGEKSHVKQIVRPRL